MLMASLDTSIANAGLPTLAAAFGASFQQVQWVVLAYLLSLTGLIISAGRLGDLVGRKRLLVTGIGLFSASSLLCGLAPSLPVLIAGRGVQGLGAALMLALSVAMVGDSVGKDRIGRAMGLLGTMSALGTSLGPSVGGFLIEGFGWRAMFMVAVPLGAANMLLAVRTLPRDVARADPGLRRFDLPGSILLVAALAAYALAMTIGQGRFGAANLALLAIAGASLGLFLLAEAKAPAPLVRLSMLREARLRTSLGMSVAVATVMMATLVVGPFYLAGALGLAPFGVGLVMAAGPLAAALAGMPAGRAVERFGTHGTTLAALVGLTLGLAALATASERFGIDGYVASIVVVTTSYALFQTANNTSVMADAAPQERGLVSGMLALSRNLGLITGASAMGALFAYASSATDIRNASPQALADGMQVTFLVAALLTLGALLAGLAQPPAFRRG